MANVSSALFRRTEEAAVAARFRVRTLARDAVLFGQALWLCRLAQGAGGRTPVPEQAASLVSHRWLPRHVSAEAAQRATLRASRRGARWFGQRDTCLVRSLVTGALLSDHDNVLLHVGFAAGGADGRALEGHAWVSVAGAAVGGPQAAMDEDRPVSELAIPVRRNRTPDADIAENRSSIDPS